MEINVKTQMIKESFEILKNSWSSKEDALRRLICKMFKIDTSAAMDMWLELLELNKLRMDDYNSYGLCDEMICGIVHGVDRGSYSTRTLDNKTSIVLAAEIFKNKPLYSIIFGKNSWMSEHSGRILSHLIVSDDTETLVDVLSLMVKNKFGEDSSLGNVLNAAIVNLDGAAVPKQNIEILEETVAQIKNKKDRAEAFTALLSLEED